MPARRSAGYPIESKTLEKKGKRVDDDDGIGSMFFGWGGFMAVTVAVTMISRG